MDLTKLNYLIRRCSKCGLCNTRKNAVPGEGSPDSNVMFIAEGPGSDENEQGKPFVGAAGKELNKVFDHIELKRESVYITNLVKCRVPNNNDPGKYQIEACFPWLEEEIRLIKPYLIVTLGRISSQYILHIDQPISKIRGLIYQIPFDGCEPLVVPIFHPASLLYSDDKRELFYKDFELIKQLLI